MNRKIKVLIHTRSLNIPGGKQSYLLGLDKYFTNEISYFYYGTLEPVKESKFDFLKRYFGDYFRFYRQLRKERYDVVHINTSFNLKSYFRDSIFTLISALSKTKTIVYWHGWNVEFQKKYADKIVPFFRLTFGKADAMICLAKEFSNKLIDYRYRKPIYTESTVVEDYIINSQPQPRRHTVGEGKEAVNVLFLSRVERPKGIFETIDSIRNLQARHPKISLTIAGTGSELENVKEYVKDNKLENVEFLGWISGKEKLKALVQSDIFVLASYTEGMPICVLEAMAVGKPVITTDVGAIKDFFEDGAMGLKVKVKDAKDIEKKVEKLFLEPNLREIMGEYNMKYAKEHFAPEQVRKRLESIYTESMKST